MSKERFAQGIHVVNASAAVALLDDFAAGDPATDIVNLSNYDKATFVYTQTAGATGTILFTVESCDTVVPGTATAIPFDYWYSTSGDTFGDKVTSAATGFTTTAGAEQMLIIEVNSSELSGTDKYVRVQATEVVDSPVSGAVTCILSGPRFTHEVMQTAIV